MKNKPVVTFITPTYNREYTLDNLYNSLLKQTNKSFKWLLVDDGSTDNTKDFAKKVEAENLIDFTYKYKTNGGKHTALNYGIPAIDTELTLIVDSDDKLLDGAVENIVNVHNKYKNNDKLACYTFLKIKKDGNLCSFNREEEFIKNYIDYRIIENPLGDMAEVFKSNILKQFKFPEFPNEKFISEDIVWIEIAKKYDSLYLNTPIYECEYLEDGLTGNDKKMKFNSPYGSMLRGKQMMYSKCGIKENIKGSIIYNAYYKDNNFDELKLNFREKLMVAFAKMPAIYFRKKWLKSINE